MLIRFVFAILFFCSGVALSQILTGDSGIDLQLGEKLDYKAIYEWVPGMKFSLMENELSNTSLRIVRENSLGAKLDWVDYFEEQLEFQGYRILDGYVSFVFKINGVLVAHQTLFRNLEEMQLKRGFYGIPYLRFKGDLSYLQEYFFNKNFYVFNPRFPADPYPGNGETAWTYNNGLPVKSRIPNESPYSILAWHVTYNVDDHNFPYRLSYYLNGSLQYVNIRGSGINAKPTKQCEDNTTSICRLDDYLVTKEFYDAWKTAFEQKMLKEWRERQKRIKEDNDRRRQLQDNLRKKEWIRHIALPCAIRKDLRNDPHDPKDNWYSEPYNLYEPNYKAGFLNVQLVYSEGKRYLKFFSNSDLGGMPLARKISIELKNSDVIKLSNESSTFYDNIAFHMVATIDDNTIKRLQRSGIASIKIYGRYSMVLPKMFWTRFFQDKLDCF